MKAFVCGGGTMNVILPGMEVFGTHSVGYHGGVSRHARIRTRTTHRSTSKLGERQCSVFMLLAMKDWFKWHRNTHWASQNSLNVTCGRAASTQNAQTKGKCTRTTEPLGHSLNPVQSTTAAEFATACPLHNMIVFIVPSSPTSHSSRA